MVSPTNHMFESSSSTIIENNLSNCTNDMYTIVNRYHRLKSSSEENLILKIDQSSSQQINSTMIIDSNLTDFYPDSYSSSSSISSFDLHSNNNDSNHINKLELKTFSSSSGYNSSLNSIPDCNIIEHLENQSSYDQEFYSPESISLSCRKCIVNNQDDSQLTTISIEQENIRPRSLPIAIQQSKIIDIDNDSSSCHCTLNFSQKKTFRTGELITTNSELHINEQLTINQKNSLEHFIMSPTDKVKIQMKYQENDIKNVKIK